MSRNRISDRFPALSARDAAAVKQIVLRRLSDAAFSSPVMDAIDLGLTVSLNESAANLTGSPAEVAQAVLEDLARLFSSAAGGAGAPAYLQTV